MDNSIHIRIEDLEKIVSAAKEAHKRDSDLSSCVRLEKGKRGESHTDSDTIRVQMLSAYAECDPKTITYINF